MSYFSMLLHLSITSYNTYRYLEFIEKSGDLNDLCNYPQLLERCKIIGYNISKVVFRGYYASPTLQAMHDNAIEKRTKLRIAVSLWAEMVSGTSYSFRLSPKKLTKFDYSVPTFSNYTPLSFCVLKDPSTKIRWTYSIRSEIYPYNLTL